MAENLLKRDVNWGGFTSSGFINVLNKYYVNPNTHSLYDVEPLSDHAFSLKHRIFPRLAVFEGIVSSYPVASNNYQITTLL